MCRRPRRQRWRLALAVQPEHTAVVRNGAALHGDQLRGERQAARVRADTRGYSGRGAARATPPGARRRVSRASERERTERRAGERVRERALAARAAGRQPPAERRALGAAAIASDSAERARAPRAELRARPRGAAHAAASTSAKGHTTYSENISATWRALSNISAGIIEEAE